MTKTQNIETVRRDDRTDLFREKHPGADRWAAGYGQIEHTPETQERIFCMAEILAERGMPEDELWDLLYALDRIASAGMWLVVHETYAQKVYRDGRELKSEDFKIKPEGHTGGSLNMIPAYSGYMAIDAITHITRGWMMGQGHCVAAIDSVNLLLDNLSPVHADRYDLSDEGLTRYVRDFYSYKLDEEGRPDSPLGSHVNPYTAGGIAEGGYLGFVQLEYVHTPLPGERLVVFLSDGAFEEQRGSDWVPRWWRNKDCGLVAPIMINNGRRIDQRSTMAQKGGTDWFVEHLKLNNFDPIVFDGGDPAAFVWAIFEIESRLEAAAKAVEEGRANYPVPIPYGIAVAEKGAGFYNAGENLAHNLPLGGNPHKDSEAAQIFNEWSRKLWVPPEELDAAIAQFRNHDHSDRPLERDNPMVWRDVSLREVPEPDFKPIPENRMDEGVRTTSQPMKAADKMFVATVRANPHLRPRVGNPDEMKSNRLQTTLDALKFRVTDPEEGIPEEIHGAVITALNEEAVAAAALANKGGINLIATYEAFGAKMHGVMRQEIIFAKHRKGIGQPRNWLSVPLMLTSHTWENGKNEQSHQDPMMSEAMLNEASDISRVLFPADYNSVGVLMQKVYQTHGQFWSVVVSKRGIADLFSREEAERMLEQGAIKLDWAGYRQDSPRVILTAIGAYQLQEVLKASARLTEREMPHSVVYMVEPGRFRIPRDEGELAHAAPGDRVAALYPESVPSRVFVTHTRPEPMLGTLQPLHTGHKRTAALGFVNVGGTLNGEGMLFVNRCSWGHVLAEVARVCDRPREDFLTSEEREALEGKSCPQGAIGSPVSI